MTTYIQPGEKIHPDAVVDPAYADTGDWLGYMTLDTSGNREILFYDVMQYRVPSGSGNDRATASTYTLYDMCDDKLQLENMYFVVLPAATAAESLAHLTRLAYPNGISGGILENENRDGFHLPIGDEDRRIWFTHDSRIVIEPINQAEYFFDYREHLARLADEFYTGHSHHGPVIESHEHDGYSIDTRVDDEGTRRNNVVTQHVRRMIGWMWREIHIWVKEDPLTEEKTPGIKDWVARHENSIRPAMEALCYACGGRAWSRGMRALMDLPLWETAVDEGRRFLPDKSTDEWGIHYMGTTRHSSVVAKTIDIQNFVRALRYHETETVRSDSYADLATDYVDNLARREALEWWRESNLAARVYIDSVAGMDATAHKAVWNRWARMNILALLRDENQTPEALAKMEGNKVHYQTWYTYIDDAALEFPDGETFWRNGFIRYDSTTNDFQRDEMSQNFYDRLTAPEEITDGGDHRVSTNTILIPREEIPRDANFVGAAWEEEWVEEDYWVPVVGGIANSRRTLV